MSEGRAKYPKGHICGFQMPGAFYVANDTHVVMLPAHGKPEVTEFVNDQDREDVLNLLSKDRPPDHRLPGSPTA